MEILYVHRLEQSTSVPTHVSSEWDRMLRTLSLGKEGKEGGGRGTVNYVDRRNGPHRQR